MLLKGFWRPHLANAEVQYRGPNNCRHTYASQLLTTGAVPLDWIADQIGHTSTAMIWRHYGKWINQDGPDMIGTLEHALKLKSRPQKRQKAAHFGAAFLYLFPKCSQIAPIQAAEELFPLETGR